MKRILFVFISIFIFTNLFSQNNLVPNHSFEDAWTCPESFVIYPISKPYPEWINPNNGTPDHIHVCSESDAGIPDNFAGSLYPYDGAAYAGIVLWEQYFSIKKDKEFSFISREYIQTKLKEPLKRNKLYCVKLQYSNASKSLFSTDALGIALTRDKITAKKGGLILQMPQVINKPGHIMENYGTWEELCGTYRASGNESYLTIGNFWDNSKSSYKYNTREGLDSTLVYAYYLIDDVRVFEIENSFECGCHNGLSYGSDWMADDYDPETGYNSLILKPGDLASNGNSDNNSGSQDGFGNDSGNNENGSGNNNNDSSGLDGTTGSESEQGEGSAGSGFNDGDNDLADNSSNALQLKKSEITDNAFDNARIGDKFNLNRIFFEFNSSELLSFSYVELDKLYNILSAKPALRIEIRGHTDDIGSSQYNKTLSVKRAEAVYNYLAMMGIDKSRMKYRGFGNKVPISDNTTEEGRSMNRRVEIIVMDL